MKKRLSRYLGIETDSTSLAEKIVATLGGFIGIFLISHISFELTGAGGTALIVPSMGASAVLVFAVPHGKLSQPWALFGGHLVSAAIGVSCYQMIPDTYLAAGAAVGLAIGAMHVLRCIHPPGGATALAAVIGGNAIHELGYQYILTPILINTTIIFVVAVVFNSVFPWRRYPVNLMRFSHIQGGGGSDINIEDKHIEQAVSEMDLIVDMTTDELKKLIELTMKNIDRQAMTRNQIKLGHYYTNGKHGGDWSVRQIIDESSSKDADRDMVIYQVVEGHGLRKADSCTRSEFAHWASHEVFINKHDRS